MSKCKFNVGDEVRDISTGFTGIVTSHTEWFDDCNTYWVRGQVLRDEDPEEWQHFDEAELILTEEKKKVTTGQSDLTLSQVKDLKNKLENDVSDQLLEFLKVTKPSSFSVDVKTLNDNFTVIDVNVSIEIGL